MVKGIHNFSICLTRLIVILQFCTICGAKAYHKSAQCRYRNYKCIPFHQVEHLSKLCKFKTKITSFFFFCLQQFNSLSKIGLMKKRHLIYDNRWSQWWKSVRVPRFGLLWTWTKVLLKLDRIDVQFKIYTGCTSMIIILSLFQK